jgi:hypothetical protein
MVADDLCWFHDTTVNLAACYCGIISRERIRWVGLTSLIICCWLPKFSPVSSICIYNIFVVHGSIGLVGLALLVIAVSISHLGRYITLGWTPVYERSAFRRGLSTWHHTALTRNKSMPLAGFEPAIPASERLQTHTWDRAATGMGLTLNTRSENVI